jgi:hypothetical protein
VLTENQENKNGLGLTKADAIDYVKFLTKQALTCNLSVGLKNAADLVTSLVSTVHYAVNEQCVTYKECATFSPFIQAKKPVFHIEYPSRSGSKVTAANAAKICSNTGASAGSDKFSTVMKDMSLNGWVQYCDGTTAVTPVIT